MTLPTQTPTNMPPYTPMSSLSHELAIMFGFIIASILVMVVYIFFWRVAEQWEKIREQIRCDALVKRGIHHEQGGIHEMILDRGILYPPPFQSVEVPGRLHLGGRHGHDTIDTERRRTMDSDSDLLGYQSPRVRGYV